MLCPGFHGSVSTAWPSLPSPRRDKYVRRGREQDHAASPRAAALAPVNPNFLSAITRTGPPVRENLFEVAIGVEERDRPAVGRPERIETALRSLQGDQCRGCHVSQDQLPAALHGGFEHEPLPIRRDRAAIVISPSPHLRRQDQLETGGRRLCHHTVVTTAAASSRRARQRQQHSHQGTHAVRFRVTATGAPRRCASPAPGSTAAPV